MCREARACLRTELWIVLRKIKITGDKIGFRLVTVVNESHTLFSMTSSTPIQIVGIIKVRLERNTIDSAGQLLLVNRCDIQFL